MFTKLPSSIVLVGAGKMGQAMLEGWLKQGLEQARIVAIDPLLEGEGRARLLERGVRLEATPDGISRPRH